MRYKISPAELLEELTQRPGKSQELEGYTSDNEQRITLEIWWDKDSGFGATVDRDQRGRYYQASQFEPGEQDWLPLNSVRLHHEHKWQKVKDWLRGEAGVMFEELEVVE